MRLKHFLRKKKKKSEHPIIEAQRETPKLLNNSKNNFFNLKITVLLDLTWSKMEGSNLLHPPTSTLSFSGEFTQYPFFVRFFTFLLLREKVCAFSSAFF